MKWGWSHITDSDPYHKGLIVQIDRIKRLARKYFIIRALFSPIIAVKRFLFTKRDSYKMEVIHTLREMLTMDPVLRVDEFSGVFAVDIRSDLFGRLILQKTYEPQLVKLCQKYIDPHRDVIDVGANVGFYSVLFAQTIADRRVLSIEPTRNAWQRLCRNIQMNNVENKVEVFHGVASNTNGCCEIKTIRGKEEYSCLGVMVHPSVAKEHWDLEEVQGATLDDLVKQYSLDPGFIKIDVEGAEHLVFGGAHYLLNEKRPIILSELSDFLLRKNGSSAVEVIDMIGA